MKSIGAVIHGMQVRGQISQPDPASPEEIERWLIERRLWPTARIAADLEAARSELSRVPKGDFRERQASADVSALEFELRLAQLRDQLQADRPADCWCYGIGGHGRVFVPTGNDEPIASWRVWCSCPDGQQLRAETDARWQEIQRARCQAAIDRLWGSLPAKYANWTLSTLRTHSSEHARLVDQVEAWLDNSKRWLFLYGPVGRGKTGVAVGALKVLAARGQTALFQETTDLLERLRQGYANLEAFTESRDQLWESLFGAQVLLLDDLGSERHRANETVDWATEQLWRLIGFRHREECRTIITSNLDLVELREHLGHARIPSRIDEVSLTLNCTGLPNLRVGARP